MSIFTSTTRITHSYLMRKSKQELADIIVANLDKINLLAETQWAPPTNISHLTGPDGQPLYRLVQHPGGKTTVERRS